MVTMARSKSISGPYESNPGNPVLTNANTTSYCETEQPLVCSMILTATQSKPSATPIYSTTATGTGETVSPQRDYEEY
jgi:beta-xylosidase